MIKVLRDWVAIGEAHVNLGRKGLPRHSTCEKAWDLYNLYQLLQPLERACRIVDLGCGGDLYPLKLADAMGFTQLCGIDLTIPLRARLTQAARMWRRRSLRAPFSLRQMDVTSLRFPDESFDVAVSLSTIEHGVDLSDFFSETGRILQRSGLLFVTTDYWEEKITVEASFRAYGLPWTIFSRHDVEAMLDLARISGLVPIDARQADLKCGEKCVVWGGKEYTFVSLAFKKAG